MVKRSMMLLIIGILFYSIIFGSVFSEMLQRLLVLIISNVVIDYFFEIYIAYNKLTNSIKYGSDFNVDYFDLYWNLSKNRVQLLLNIVLFSISLESFFIYSEDIIARFLNSICLVVLGFILWIVICHLGKKQQILFQLLMKKQQNYHFYNDEELKLIKKLK
ncbi:TPA: hypothetical protein ACGOY6_001239 [Streptococcus suis]